MGQFFSLWSYSQDTEHFSQFQLGTDKEKQLLHLLWNASWHTALQVQNSLYTKSFLFSLFCSMNSINSNLQNPMHLIIPLLLHQYQIKFVLWSVIQSLEICFKIFSRCGHMCTCFKCAHDLLWSSGRCPVCRALIVDVVKACSNF